MVLGVAVVVVVRKRRRRVARVERVVKEGMVLYFLFLLGWWMRMTERAWVAREGTVVLLVVVVGWSVLLLSPVIEMLFPEWTIAQ